jgi:hypothetical protein
MAQNYTRQSSFADGDTITAALFNNEFNQVVNAFSYSASSDSSTGHKHDGTAGQGGNIPQIGDIDFLNKIVVDNTNNRWGFYVQVSSGTVEQLRIQDGAIVPVTDDDIDLGTSSLEFKDLFLDGTAHIDTLDVDVNATVAGTLGVTGATTLSSTLGVTGATTLSSTLGVTGAITGSSTLQATTITATTAFVPDASDGASLGTSALEFSDLFLADGAVINFGADQDVSLTHVADTGLLLNSTMALQFNDASQYINAPSATVLDINATDEIELNATLVDVNANLDVSGTVTATGTSVFASLDISGDIDVDGTTNLDVVDIDGAVNIAAATTIATDNKIQFRDTAIYVNSSTDGQLDIVADTEVQIAATTVDINGAVDISGNLDVGGNLVVTGTTTFNGGTLTMGDAATDNVVFGADINSNIIPNTDDTYDLGSSSQEWRNLYIDGTANIDSLVADTADINGGTVDGVTIGGSSAGDITYANLSDGTITITAFVDEDDMSSDSATLVPTQQSVKAYVDSQVGTVDTLSEILANGNTTGSTDIAVDSAQKVQFRDAAIYLNSSVDGQLDIVADTEIQIAATTVDLNGNLDVSGTALVAGVLTTTAATVFNGGFASNADSTLGTDKKVQFRDAAIYINSSVDGQLDIVADTEIQIAATTIDINGAINASGEIIAASLDISGDIDVDGTTNLDVVDIDGAVDMASTLGVTGVLTTTAATVFNGGFASNAASTITTADNLDTLSLISTDADSDVGPIIRLWRNSSSPADNDGIGAILFSGEDSADAKTDYASIESFALDVTNGTEDGELTLYTVLAGAKVNRLDFNSTETIFNSPGADLDFRVESDTYTHALFVQGSDGNVGIGVTPTEKLDISQSVNNSVITKVTNTNSGDLASARVEIYNDNSSFGQLTTYSSGFDFNVLGSNAANWTFLGTSGSNSNGLKIGTLTADPVVFGTSDLERMRILADGSVVQGNTVSLVASNYSNQAGAAWHKPDGHYEIATTSDVAPLQIGKNNANNGSLLVFRKQSDVVGSIGSRSDVVSHIILDPRSGGAGLTAAGASLFPTNNAGTVSDGAIDLGYSVGGTNYRFKDLHLSGGVYLGGSVAANLLDDYEEGDWTPAFANIGTGTYTHQVGRYTKVGNLVTASVHIDINVLGTASGSLDITNLPFTASAVSNNYGSASSIHAQNFTTAAEGLNVLINPNTAVANVFSGSGATSGAVNVTHAVMGTGNFLCTLVYFAA